MSHYFKFGLSILMLAIPVASRAELIYSNFDVSLGYDASSGNIAGNDFMGDTAGLGDTFTATAAVKLSTIEIALSCFQAGLCPDVFTVALNTDNGGDAPGATLESFTLAGSSLGSLGTYNTPITLTSLATPALAAGAQYWLTVTAPLTDSVVWNSNSTGDSSDQAFSSDGGATWFSPSGLTPGAYEIDGTAAAATPEPGTVFLFAAGGLMIGLRRKLLG